MLEYFIVYQSYDTRGKLDTGNMVIASAKKIQDTEQVRHLEDCMKDALNQTEEYNRVPIKNILITNFILVKGDTDEK